MIYHTKVARIRTVANW